MADPKPPLRGVDIGLNLLVSIVVTGGLGYAVDSWLGTAPAGMLTGGLLGFAAWLYTVWKLMKQKG